MEQQHQEGTHTLVLILHVLEALHFQAHAIPTEVPGADEVTRELATAASRIEEILKENAIDVPIP
jgi:hypothetical protein